MATADGGGGSKISQMGELLFNKDSLRPRWMAAVLHVAPSTGHLLMQRVHGGTAENHGHGVFVKATPTPHLHVAWRGGGGPDSVDTGRHSVIFVILSFG
jgi:hypothetical protein